MSFYIQKSLISSLFFLFLIPVTLAVEPLNSSRGNAFNPDTSVNILGLARHSNKGGDYNNTPGQYNGFLIQEAELQFTAAVDPYFRAVSLFSVAPEDYPNHTTYGFEPEEIYLETTSIPVVNVRAGKFKTALGKHNALHTHAFSFIDAPLFQSEILGEEGLNDVGISAAALLGFVPWFSELTAQLIQGNGAQVYGSLTPNDVAHVFRFKNLWDLSESTTFEWGVSNTSGINSQEGKTTLTGTDLTIKWRPIEGGKYTSLSWSTEYLGGRRNEELLRGERLGGVSSWLQVQFQERWWAQARYEYFGTPHSDVIPRIRKQSLLLGYLPSEFSGFRFQYDHKTVEREDQAENRFMLQYNISIGAHPAHAY